jgi:uncharacterized BrkB/YihY/UPF0761 family membrane protein
VGLLFYLYLCASVVLVGAEVNATIYDLISDGGIQPGADHATAEAVDTGTRDA